MGSQGFADRLLLAKGSRSFLQVSRRLNLSAQAVHHYVKRGNLSIRRCEQLAKALGVSPAWLAYGEGDDEPES